MIDSTQLVNCLWMGTVLLMLGLVPGLYSSLGEALTRFSRELRPMLLARSSHSHADFTPAHWFVPAGCALIIMGLLAYLAK